MDDDHDTATPDRPDYPAPTSPPASPPPDDDGLGPRTPHLACALLEAQRSVVVVAKDRTATVTPKREGAKPYTYRYAAGDDLARVGKVALNMHDLVLSPRPGRPWDVELVELGSVRQAWITIHAVLEHAPSGERRAYAVRLPMSGNDGDKAVSGAITYGLAQLYRFLVGISREESEDPDRRTAPGRTIHEPAPQSTRRTVEPAREPDAPERRAANSDPEVDLARRSMHAAWRRLGELADYLHQARPDWGAFVAARAPLGRDRNGDAHPWPLQPSLDDYRLGERAVQRAIAESEGAP